MEFQLQCALHETQVFGDQCQSWHPWKWNYLPLQAVKKSIPGKESLLHLFSRRIKRTYFHVRKKRRESTEEAPGRRSWWSTSSHSVIASRQLCLQAGAISRVGSQGALRKSLPGRNVNLQKPLILVIRQTPERESFYRLLNKLIPWKGRRQREHFLRPKQTYVEPQPDATYGPFVGPYLNKPTLKDLWRTISKVWI